MTHRATLYKQLHKLKNKHGNLVSSPIIQNLSQVEYHMHTITFDNDKGFADNMTTSHSLTVKTYFTRPHIPVKIKRLLKIE